MIKQSKPKSQSGVRSAKASQLVRKSKTATRTATRKVTLPRGRSVTKRSK